MYDEIERTGQITDELGSRKFTGFRLEPTNVTPNRVDIKAVLEK